MRKYLLSGNILLEGLPLSDSGALDERLSYNLFSIFITHFSNFKTFSMLLLCRDTICLPVTD